MAVEEKCAGVGNSALSFSLAVALQCLHGSSPIAVKFPSEISVSQRRYCEGF